MNRSIPNSPGEARLAKLKADVSKDMGLPSAWEILGTSKWGNDCNLITTLKESSLERHARRTAITQDESQNSREAEVFAKADFQRAGQACKHYSLWFLHL